MKLSESEDINTGIKYNSILVIVNKLIKYAHLIFCSEKFTVRQTTYIVLDKVIRYHSISESIISDKDKIFISNF